MSKTLFQIFEEKSVDDIGMEEYRKILDAVKVKTPPQIEKAKALFLNEGEYELYAFLDRCIFYEVRNKNAPGWHNTYGVRPANHNEIEFYFDKDFLIKNSKNPREFLYVLAHEALHIFRYHMGRSEFKFKYSTLMDNVAQDMVINNDIDEIKNIAGISVAQPEDPKPLTLPDEFKKHVNNNRQEYYYERVREWLDKQQEQIKKQTKKEMLKPGSIVKVKKGDNAGEYRKIKSVRKKPNGEYEYVTVPLTDKEKRDIFG